MLSKSQLYDFLRVSFELDNLLEFIFLIFQIIFIKFFRIFLASTIKKIEPNKLDYLMIGQLIIIKSILIFFLRNELIF